MPEYINNKTGEVITSKFKTHYNNTRVDAEVIDGEHMTDDTSFTPLKEVIARCDRQTLIHAYEEALTSDIDDDDIDIIERNGYDLADLPLLKELEEMNSASEVQGSAQTKSSSDEEKPNVGETNGTIQEKVSES